MMIRKIMIAFCLLFLSLQPAYAKSSACGLYRTRQKIAVYDHGYLGSISKGKPVTVYQVKGNQGVISFHHRCVKVPLNKLNLIESEEQMISDSKAGVQTDQIVVVNGPVSKNKWETNYKVSLWTKSGDRWQESLCTLKGYCGINGMRRHRRRGDLTTPIGCFPMTFSFGTHRHPGALLPYKKINNNSYWYYGNNTYRESQTPLPGEHLMDSRKAYEYAIFIDFNDHAKVKKAGGAIMLHCQRRYHATAGCVAIDRRLMKRYLTTIRKNALIIITPEMQDLKDY